jgi:hypothetical protein
MLLRHGKHLPMLALGALAVGTAATSGPDNPKASIGNASGGGEVDIKATYDFIDSFMPKYGSGRIRKATSKWTSRGRKTIESDEQLNESDFVDFDREVTSGYLLSLNAWGVNNAHPFHKLMQTFKNRASNRKGISLDHANAMHRIVLKNYREELRDKITAFITKIRCYNIMNYNERILHSAKLAEEYLLILRDMLEYDFKHDELKFSISDLVHYFELAPRGDMRSVIMNYSEIMTAKRYDIYVECNSRILLLALNMEKYSEAIKANDQDRANAALKTIQNDPVVAAVTVHACERKTAMPSNPIGTALSSPTTTSDAPHESPVSQAQMPQGNDAKKIADIRTQMTSIGQKMQKMSEDINALDLQKMLHNTVWTQKLQAFEGKLKECRRKHTELLKTLKSMESDPSARVQLDQFQVDFDLHEGSIMLLGDDFESILLEYKQSPEQAPSSPEQALSSPEQAPSSPEQAPSSPETKWSDNDAKAIENINDIMNDRKRVLDAIFEKLRDILAQSNIRDDIKRRAKSSEEKLYTLSDAHNVLIQRLDTINVSKDSNTLQPFIHDLGLHSRYIFALNYEVDMINKDRQAPEELKIPEAPGEPPMQQETLGLAYDPSAIQKVREAREAKEKQFRAEQRAKMERVMQQMREREQASQAPEELKVPVITQEQETQRREASRPRQRQYQRQQRISDIPRVVRQKKDEYTRDDNIIPTLDPRDPISVAQYLERYHITATANKFSELMHAFPGTYLLGPEDVTLMNSVVHLKHYLGEILENSVLLRERFSPRGLWSRESVRQKFFFDQLSSNPGYYVKDAEFWKSADKIMKYVPVVSPELIASIINTFDPRKILDTNVMFGSAIAALAIAKPQSAQYDGLCSAGSRFPLESLVMHASARPTFMHRINLMVGSISIWSPARGMYDMIISEIRTRNSEIIAKEPPQNDSADINIYLSSRIIPLLSKVKSGITTSGAAVFLLTTDNPDLNDIRKCIASEFSIKDTKVSGEHTALICTLAR